MMTQLTPRFKKKSTNQGSLFASAITVTVMDKDVVMAKDIKKFVTDAEAITVTTRRRIFITRPTRPWLRLWVTRSSWLAKGCNDMTV